MSEVEIEEALDEEPVMTYRDYVESMRAEVGQFVAEMISEYSSCNGRDMRSELSWHMEEAGVGIRRQLEKEKRARREAGNGKSDR